MYRYPYPKKAKVKFYDSYKDGGTKIFRVINNQEIGLAEIYQDFRMDATTTRGKFYTSYPGYSGAQEILANFVEIEEDAKKKV